MTERTPEEFAIEFGEYMAKSALAYQNAVCDTFGKARIVNNVDFTDLVESHRQLLSAIYEFRKRAQRTNAWLGNPTTPKPTEG